MTKIKCVLMSFIILSCLMQNAYASKSDVYPIYALADANTLYGIINGIAALMNSSMFKDVLICFGLLGLFFTLFIVAIKRSFNRLPIHLVGVSLFIYIALNIQVTVQIIGQLDGKTYAVNHVPGILAVPASWLSILGYEGAKLIDLAYSTVDGMDKTLTLTGGTPFSITNQLMEDATTYQIKDSYLNASMIHFIVDCVVPSIANGKLTMTALVKSNNIWGLFTPSILNPSLMTVSFGTEAAPSPAGNVLTCPEAHDAIEKIMPKAQADMVAGLSKNLMAGLSATLFQETLNYNAKSSLYNPKPGEYLQQAAILNLLKGPVHEYMAGKSQSAMLMQSLAVSQAVAATETSWITSAEVFAKTMGYIFSALQILVFAVAPILLLFFVFPGAGLVLAKRYFSLLAWFPMTFIMLAICNDLILSWTHNDLTTIFNNYNGLVQGSQAIIAMKAAKMQAVGAFLISVTPIISWGIVAGLQMPITSILSHSGALTFGSQAGEKSVTGNESLDQQSYNNVSANKSNTTSSMDMGATPIELSAEGGNSSLKGNFGGESAILNGAPDMTSHQSHTQVQRSQTTANSYSTDEGGSVSDDSGFHDGATAGQTASNAVNTSIDGGVGFNKMATSIKGAMKAAAVAAGVTLPLAAMNAAANDLAHAKEMSDKAHQADVAGDPSAREQYQQQSEGFFSHAIHSLKQEWDEADWKKKAVIGGVGAIVAAGAAIAFASGVGEVAAAGVLASEAGLVGAGAAEGSALIGGMALAGAAVREGVAPTVGRGLMQATKSGIMKMGSKGAVAGGVVGGVFGGLTNGFHIGIKESVDGRLNTHLGTEFSAKSSHAGQERGSYNATQRVDDQTHITTSESTSPTFQTPSQDFYNALGVLNPEENPNSSIEMATNKYNSDQYQVKQSSEALQQKVRILKQKTREFHGEAKDELADRKRVNQLNETKLQKNAKDRTVS